jgi:hypothetical protein
VLVEGYRRVLVVLWKDVNHRVAKHMHAQVVDVVLGSVLCICFCFSAHGRAYNMVRL